MTQEHFSRSDYDILLLHVIRDPGTFMDFVRKTDEPVFDPAQNMGHDFLDKLLRELFHETGEYPSPTTLRVRMEEALDGSSFDEDLKGEVKSLLSFAEKVPEKDLQPDLARKTLERVIASQMLVSAGDRIKSLLARGDFHYHSLLSDLSDEKDRRRIGVANDVRILKPFADMDKYLVESEVFPTGIEFVDILLRGGPWRHDLLGLLAPSGGGKTTFSIQLATSWIRRDPRRCAMILSYEQPIEGDISSRLCSASSGLPVTEFRGKRLDQLSPETRKKYEDSAETFKDNFQFIDMSGGRSGTRGIEDIRAILTESNIPETGPPTLVIIDWFLPCIQRAMVGAGVHMSSEALRLFGSHFMDDLKILKNNWNVVFLVTHQLNCEKASASSSRKPVWQDAAEWKGFAWFMDVCFAIGSLSEDYVCWFCASKVRSTAASDRMVKLKGDYIKFVEADNEYMMAHGKIVPKVQVMDDMQETPSRARRLDVGAAAQFEG